MIKDFTSENEELLKKVADGDEVAREELIVRNMGLVHSVVKRFVGRGYDIDDLTQIGSIGLIRAAERFNAEFGVKFSTYAIPMIIGEIKRFIRDDGMIKVSRGLKETAIKAMSVKERLCANTGCEPSIAEIAAEIGISAADLAVAMESQVRPQSIYASADDGTSEMNPLIDKIESKRDEIGDMVNKVTLRQMICELKERDKKIVYMRYFKMKTQAQTAEMLGISQVQVSRLEKKILAEMRKKLCDE